MIQRNVAKLVLILSLALVLVGLAPAQTGQVSGLITDPSGASVPAAQVVVSNQDTGIERTVETNGSGFFVLTSIQPGTYRVTATADGFQSLSRTDIKIDVEQVARIDLQLVIGTNSETVEVTQVGPLLETSRATMGTVIGNKRIIDLPLNERDPFMLVGLTPGVNVSGRGSTPLLGGGRNAMSEVTIDGTSNVAPENNVGINRLVYTPQVDSVQEFKVEVNSLAAEYGRFSGGMVNLVTKSGNNELHGTGYWFLRRDELDANNFFANRAGLERTDLSRNQYGGTIGGPVVKGRTFFFASYEGRDEMDQAVSSRLVPFDSWKAGDFSNIGQFVSIYDPWTGAVDSKGRFRRKKFSNNLIPESRINNVAASTQDFIPTATNPEGFDNRFVSGGSSSREGYSTDFRVDDNPTDYWRIFGRWSGQVSDSAPFLPWDNPAAPASGPLQNFDQVVSLDNTFTLSPTAIANVRLGFGRANLTRDNHSLGFDLRTLGFADSLYDQASTNSLAFPRFSFSDFPDSIGATNFTQLDNVSMNYSLAGSVTKVMNRHTFKAGVEARRLAVNFSQFGSPSGSFSFDSDWTRRQVGETRPDKGQSYASFLLGLPERARINHDPAGATASYYYGLYLQDDWRVSNKLTVNLGLRYDVDVPRTERFDRLSFFDPDVPSAIAGMATSPVCSECDNLRGALQFVNDGNRRQTSTDTNNWGPRVGFAYQANNKTVVRAGYGISYLPSLMQAAGTTGTSGMQGFRTRTDSNISFDNGRTINLTLDDPFGDGFNLPTGGALGAFTDLGFGISDSFFNNAVSGMSQQWNLNVQRELPGDISVEVGYMGNRGSWLPDGDGGRSFNQLPTELLSLGDQLISRVDNPFFGVITDPLSPLSQPEVNLNQLLRPFPQFTDVSANRKSNGNSMYHAFTIRVDKRFDNGLSFLLAFTGSKLMDDASSTVGFLGPATGSRLDHNNRRNEWSLSSFDISRRFVASWVYELPFGKGKSFGGGARGTVGYLISGWQTNGILTLSGGTPLWIDGLDSDHTGIFSGQRANNDGRSARITGGTTDERISEWFDTDVFSVPEPYTLGNVSRTLPDVRVPGLRSVDLSLFKNNYIGESYNVQFRVEMFNALNSAHFLAPDNNINSSGFGSITSARSARQIQLATKFIF